MIGLLFVPLWAALQICFARWFFGVFLEVKRRREDVAWIDLTLWLLLTVYGLFQVEGIHSYLMYLLAVVLMLLTVFGEYGPKGLYLLLFSCLIPVTVDGAVLRMAGNLGEIYRELAVTGGRILPLLLIPLVRSFRQSPVFKGRGEVDGDNLLLRQHMEMQQESMAALEQNYRMQRKSAHEFEHHMQVLRDLLDRGEVASAREYLARLKKNRSIRTIQVNSNHPVIDVILNQKYQTARENEIKMQIKVNDLSGVSLPSDSLVVVLTNLLDNAIEACRRLEGYREIFCSILYDDGLYISIRNTSKEVIVVDGKIPTSKADSLSHGFGLLSVTYVLDELGAEYTFGYDEGWFHFAAEIE